MSKLFKNTDLGLLLFRLFIGLTMAFSHGLGKLPPSAELIAGVGMIGFPMPVVFAWAASLSEFLGGILIAVGFKTRFAAAFLAFTMGVAGFIVHGADPFAKKELAFLYFFSCILMIFSGAGKYSVDRK